MVEKNLEEGGSSQIASISSPKSVQNFVEPKPTEVTIEGGNTNLQKTASTNFEAPMQQEFSPILILIDNKSNLQENSVQQKASIGDSVTFSSEVDNIGLPSVKEDSYGFPSVSSKVDESRETIRDLIAMQPSEENTHAVSQTLVRLREEVQCTPLHNIQNGASCSDSEKVACETPLSIVTKVKQDKPRVVHRLPPEHQMSLGDTRLKVPAPVSRSNSGKFLRTDKTFVDTATHIESVKVAASRFGGSINWKTRRTQPLQGSEHVVLELDMLKKEISECKRLAEEASENKNVPVFHELDRTKKLIEELKHDLERAHTEEAHAKEDLEFFQFILQGMEEGVASDDNVVGKEKLKIIQEPHEAVVSKLKLVKDELQKVQEDYDSLLIEQDISIRKSQAALTVSKEAERRVEELTVENNKLKGVLDLANATCHDAEEHRLGTSMARDEDCLTWEKNLRQAEEELNQLNNKLSSVEDLKLKLETSSNLLLKLNNELTAYMEAKKIEEAQEEKKTRESMQEEISLARNELKEHRKSIDKVRDEVCALKAAAASLKLELSKEKAALATMQQMEAMASITVSSLKVEMQLAQQEVEAVQAKEKESRNRMVELPKILQDAAQEADEAKYVAVKAQEKLRKAREEVEQAKAGLTTMEFRLRAVLKEIEVAKESERLALDALRALEESENAVNIEDQGSPRMTTLDLDEYSSLVAKSHQAADLVQERTAAAIAQVEVAKESESRSLSRLSEIYKVLEERKRALHAATEQAGRATEGKLAMEHELRKWREENGQRRKAGEASKSEVKHANTAVIIVERNGDTKGTSKEDCYASVHPLSDVSARNSPNDSASLVKTKKTKKLPFFPRITMCFRQEEA